MYRQCLEDGRQCGGRVFHAVVKQNDGTRLHTRERAARHLLRVGSFQSRLGEVLVDLLCLIRKPNRGAKKITRLIYALIAHLIFVEWARLFLLHSSADGRITSVAILL